MGGDGELGERRPQPWTAAGQPLLAALVAGLIAYAAGNSGGYFPSTTLTISAVCFAGCALGTVIAGSAWRPSAAAATALGALIGLAAWTGLSAAWSPDPDGAYLAMLRALGYAAALLLCILAVGNGRRAALLLRLVVGVLVGICVIALLSRLRPASFDVDPTLLTLAQGRLAYPLGYWNAVGAVAAMAIVGCAGLAADAREHVALRAGCAAGGALATCVLYLTISRAAGLALVAALGVVLAVSPRRIRLTVAAAVQLGAGAVGALVLHAHPVLVDRPGTEAEQMHAGERVLGALVAIVLAAAVVQLAVGRIRALNRDRSPHSGRVRTRRHVSGAAFGVPAALVVLAFLGVYATSSDTLEGQAANGTVGLRSLVDRQYGAFMDTSRPVPAGQERLGTARSSRSDAYRVAIDGLEAHPFRGDGAAGYTVRWFRERDVPEDFRNAHSLELETASELGIVGLAFLLAFLGAAGSGLRGLRRARGGLTRAQGASAGGIVLVWTVHSALDWDWQMPAVTIPALACAAALLSEGRPVAGGRAGMVARRRRAALTRTGSHA